MKLNHVTLVVTNLEGSKAFYRALGLVQIVDTPPCYARFVCPDGDATLSIEVTGEKPVPSAQLYFECDTLDATVDVLKSRGLQFVQDPTDMFYLWREARLRDPDGHGVRLYFAGDNRLHPPALSAERT